MKHTEEVLETNRPKRDMAGSTTVPGVHVVFKKDNHKWIGSMDLNPTVSQLEH